MKTRSQIDLGKKVVAKTNTWCWMSVRSQFIQHKSKTVCAGPICIFKRLTKIKLEVLWQRIQLILCLRSHDFLGLFCINDRFRFNWETFFLHLKKYVVKLTLYRLILMIDEDKRLFLIKHLAFLLSNNFVINIT